MPSSATMHAPHNHAHPPATMHAPCNHTCPLATTHAPSNHACPQQPCMPLATMYPPATMHAPPPTVNRMTNRCKNITLSQTSFAGNKNISFEPPFNKIQDSHFLGGLSLHLNHLIASHEANYNWPFGTLPFKLFGSNLGTRDLETYPRTFSGHF